MRFDERFLDDLKSRLRPSDVIGRSVKLKRQGREWVGLSPFTKEKSPSFFVNDDKRFFHDFSSGKHGDIISFLQETQRMSFREAIEILAAEAGLALPAEDPRAVQREEARKGLEHWLEMAARYFESALRRPQGTEARAYIAKRGLPEDQWPRFRLGYAPSTRTGLRDALVQRGAKPAELVAAGLLIQPDDGGQPYDRFRDRLIFPITDGRGRLISFGGRALNPEDRAKYLNGPETTLFHKGSNLYGHAEARKLIGQNREATLAVVEGYMDVIACQRAGIAAVAPMGTALTEEQIGVLWRLHRSPTVCFDADAAGGRAKAKLIERALPLLRPDRTFQFVTITGGKDPDDIYREVGPTGLREEFARTEEFYEALYEVALAEAGSLETPEAHAGFKSRLRKAAATIADGELASTYKEFLLGRYHTAFRPSADEVRSATRVLKRDGYARRWEQLITGASPEGVAAARRQANALNPVQAAIARALVEMPAVVLLKAETIQTQGLGNDRLDHLVDDMIAILLDMDIIDEALLQNRLEALGHKDTLDMIIRDAKVAHAPFLDPHMTTRHASEMLGNAIDTLTRIQSLQRAIEAMKTELTFEFEAFVRLKHERDALIRASAAGTIWSNPKSDTVH